jgi:hypothetical protein
VPQTRFVDDPQLGNRKCRGNQRIGHIGVGQFRAHSLASRSDDGRVVEGRVWEVVDREPRRVVGYRRIEVRRHQRDVRRRDDSTPRVSLHVTASLELLEKPDFRQVHLDCEVTTQGRPESLVLTQWSSRQRPEMLEGLESALPQQNVKGALSYLEDRRENFVLEPPRRIDAAAWGENWLIHFLT